MATASNIKRQVAAIQRNARQLMRSKMPRDIERALTTVGVVVANKALEYTPVEFSLLVNSQYQILSVSPNSYSVRVGYTQDYAAPLHERKDWSPRPPGVKDGPAWNPSAKPKFLTSAAKEERPTITRIVLGDLRL